MPGFHWGWCGEEGGKKGGKERDGHLIFFKETPKNNGFCKNPGIQRGVFKDMSAFMPWGMSFMVN